MHKIENKYSPEIISSTCLLLSIAQSDDNLEKNEVDSIKEIISDFFKINLNKMDEIIDISLERLDNSTDLYEFSKELNISFTYQDKVDFICCTFEVAFADGTLHYLEEFFIKKISNILNVEHKDLIQAKKELKLLLKT